MKGRTGADKKRESETEKQGLPHVIGNIIGIVFIAVLLPIMCVNMTLIIKSYVYPDRVPAVFGVSPLIVQSGSMSPAIQVDDLIFVREVDHAKLKVDDVVAFQPAGVVTVVTHRITEVYDEQGALMFRTKGDWNNTGDVDPIHHNQVVGQYFYRIPKLGRLAMFLQQPVGMVIFVVVPLALFLLYDLLRRFLYNRKHKDENDADKEELERLRALAASLEQGGGALPEAEAEAAPAAPVFVPAPDIAAPAAPVYPPVEGEEDL